MTKNLFKMGLALAACTLLAMTATTANADTNVDTLSSWNGSASTTNVWAPNFAGGYLSAGQAFNVASTVNGAYGAYFNASLRIDEKFNSPTNVKFVGQIYAWDSTNHKVTGSALWTSSPVTILPAAAPKGTWESLSFSGQNIASGIATGNYIFVVTGVAGTSQGVNTFNGNTGYIYGSQNSTGYNLGQIGTSTNGGSWFNNAYTGGTPGALQTTWASGGNDLAFTGNFSTTPEGDSLAMLVIGGLPLIGMGFRRLRKK